MKKQKGFIIPIVIILALVILAVIVYFFSPKSISTISVKIPSSSPVASLDPTTNWKIYNNTDFKFTFKYPEQLTSVAKLEYPELVSISKEEKISYANEDMVIKNWDLNASISEFENLEMVLEQVTKEPDSFEIKQTTINNLPAVRYRHCEMACADIALINIDSKIIKFQLYTTSKIIGLSDPNVVFDQILSTFKFIDDNELSCNVNSDCEVESCGCTPKNKNYIDQKRNICTVICNKPSCVDNICVISK